jgi:hypothetical protein
MEQGEKTDMWVLARQQLYGEVILHNIQTLKSHSIKTL